MQVQSWTFQWTFKCIYSTDECSLTGTLLGYEYLFIKMNFVSGVWYSWIRRSLVASLKSYRMVLNAQLSLVVFASIKIHDKHRADYFERFLCFAEFLLWLVDSAKTCVLVRARPNVWRDTKQAKIIRLEIYFFPNKAFHSDVRCTLR